jgi:TolB protein
MIPPRSAVLRAALALAALALTPACDDSVGPGDSPLPELIVFQSGPAGSFDETLRDLYLMRPDGSDVVRLTNGLGAHGPEWSPDGMRIAFASALPDDRNIYVIDADGSDLSPVTTGSTWKYHPSWSPDGERLTFASEWIESAGLKSAVFTVDVDGGEPTLLFTCDHLCQYPTWSPDGTRLAVAWWVPWEGHPGWFIPNVRVFDTGGTAWMLGSGLLKEHVPTWSRDGSSLLFGGGPTVGGGYDLYLVDPDGGTPTRLTTGGSCWGATFSRDGASILYDAVWQGDPTLYVMNVDGTDPRRLLNRPGSHQLPSWRP